MGWVDEVPRSGGLYIGGLHAIHQKHELFGELGITHIVSVIDLDMYAPGYRSRLAQFKRLHIDIPDLPNENLLQHFAAINAFIESAVGKNEKVFIHCAMGKSRSATIVCAYLCWKFGVTPTAALEQLCEGRPVCSPNPGFLEQLEVYHHMLRATNSADSRRIYDTWLQNRFIGDVVAWEKRHAEAKL